MAGRSPFTNLDPAIEQLLVYICTRLIPAIPVPYTGLTTHVPASDGFDYISHLPRQLQRKIVSRLPVTDAARTSVLSSRWRKIWLSLNPVVIDAYLRPDDYDWPPTPANSPAITAAVTGILEGHPGPFHCVHLTCSYMDAYQAQLARWLQLLADKGVRDLVLVNRPLLCSVPLPDTLFTITTLVRLYIGLWKLPDMARLGHYGTFPRLRELGICSTVMEQGDIDSVVARCPVLEILSIQGSSKGLRLHLKSHSLRCLQICGSMVEEIAVVKAPRLERLILHGCQDRTDGRPTSVKILYAPELRAFGFLEPESQVLEIGGTIVMAGIKKSPSSVLTTVTILSLNLRFGVRSDVDMVPRFLKSFPNVKRLHIMSRKCNQSTSTLKLKFKEVHTESSMSHLEEVYFRDFQGQEGEVAFLKVLFKSAKALREAMILMAHPRQTEYSPAEAASRVKDALKLSSSPGCKVVTGVGTSPRGGRKWIFEDGADFAVEDPFLQQWRSSAVVQR